MCLSCTRINKTEKDMCFHIMSFRSRLNVEFVNKPRMDISLQIISRHTRGEGAPNVAGHGVSQDALRPAGQDRQQQAGDPAQALAAGEALARRAGNLRALEGFLPWLPEAEHPPKPAECTYL